MHSLGRYLIDHPDVELPDVVRASRHIHPDRVPDPAERLAQVVAFAAAHGVPVGEGPHHVWAVLPIGTHATNGIHVDYVLQAAKSNPRLVVHHPHPLP